MSNNPGPDHGIDHGSYPGQSVPGWGNPVMQGTEDVPDTGQAPAFSYRHSDVMLLDGVLLRRLRPVPTVLLPTENRAWCL